MLKKNSFATYNLNEVHKLNHKNIKVGVIGVGGAGRAHSKRFLRNNHVEEVRGFDIKTILEFNS
jgi:hypothetical protein